jgi:uncharacterized protein (TIGR03435 family)
MPEGGRALFTAIQEQLGIRLETRQAPADVIVVERSNGQATIKAAHHSR